MSNANLLSHLEALTGPSREIDSDFAVASGQYAEKHDRRPGWVAKTIGGAWVPPPEYTKSIDAAVSAVPDDMDYTVSRDNARGLGFWAAIGSEDMGSAHLGANPAILRARETEGK